MRIFYDSKSNHKSFLTFLPVPPKKIAIGLCVGLLACGSDQAFSHRGKLVEERISLERSDRSKVTGGSREFHFGNEVARQIVSSVSDKPEGSE